MVGLLGKEREVAKLLKDAIALDYDTLAAFAAAIERLSGDGDRQVFTQFLADHRRHVEDLGAVLEEMGVKPPTTGDLKGVLSTGKVVVGGWVNDTAVLMAMRTNENDSNRFYERAVTHPSLPPHLTSLMQEHYADERRHLAWIEQRLSMMRMQPLEESPSSPTPSVV